MEDEMLEALMIVLVGVAALIAFAARKPDVFRVERTAVINARPETIFPLIDDLRAWDRWSPWAKKDPAAKGVHSGAASGVGAAFAWDGNKQVGKGRMEIVASEPAKRVAYKLDFEKPFEGHNEAVISLMPEGGATRVSWVMTGPMPFISKVMCMFFDMDKMIGRDFEAGLASIKEIAERG
jgi:uncharacterized protein YndB with AHSA1/START domain